MYKILFLTNYPSPYRVTFFNQLGSCADIELTVLFLSSPNEQKHRNQHWFIEDYDGFSAVFCDPQKAIGSLHPEVLMIIKHPYDFIIFGGYADLSFLLAMQILHIRRIPYSIEIDGGLVKKDSLFRKTAKRILLSSAHSWLSPGKQADQYLIHYGAKVAKIFHYPFSSVTESGMAMGEKLRPRKTELRQKLGFSNSKYILYVGQLIHRKGIDTLLDATEMLPESVKVLCIGGIPSEAQSVEWKLPERKLVEFIGFKTQEELAEYYAAADMLVLPTREDIWGLVINEAMVYGLPVVSTDCCVAAKELVRDGENGYIVPANEPKALADAIIKVLPQSDEMGKRSADRIRGYTIEQMVKAHLYFFDSEK